MGNKQEKRIRKAVRDYGKSGQEIITSWLIAQMSKPFKFRVKLAWQILRGVKTK